MGHALQDVIPPRAPLDIVVLLELHRVRVADGELVVVVRGGLYAERRALQKSCAAIVRRIVPMVDRARRDFHG